MVCDQPTTTALAEADSGIDAASPDVESPDTATRQRSGYRDAIDLMIARHARPEADASTDRVPPELAPGLADLCARLLHRYERLSVMNRYAEPAIGPLEHLRLLALLDDHQVEAASLPDRD